MADPGLITITAITVRIVQIVDGDTAPYRLLHQKHLLDREFAMIHVNGTLRGHLMDIATMEEPVLNILDVPMEQIVRIVVYEK